MDWWGAEVLALDRPFPVDPEEAKISQVVGLSSSQMVELLRTGQVNVEIDGETRNLEIIEYGKLGREKLFGNIVEYIFNKETEAMKLATEQGIEKLVINQAIKYLEDYEDSNIAFMGAYLYTIFGWSGDWVMSGEGQSELLEVLAEDEREQFESFWGILEEVEKDINNEERITAEKVNLFELELEGRLREAGMMSGSASLEQIYAEASHYFQKMGEAMAARGSVKGEDLGLDNSAKNEGWLNLYLMVKEGRLYGKPVDAKTRYDASKLLGFMFAMMRTNVEYDQAVWLRDVGASKLFLHNFEKTEERIKINDEIAPIRQFRLANDRIFGVVVDEAEKKTLAGFTRKRIMGAKAEEIADVYRRSVIVVGEYKDKELSLFDDLETSKKVTIELVKEFINRAKTEELEMGSKERQKGVCLLKMGRSARSVFGQE